MDVLLNNRRYLKNQCCIYIKQELEQFCFKTTSCCTVPSDLYVIFHFVFHLPCMWYQEYHRSMLFETPLHGVAWSLTNYHIIVKQWPSGSTLLHIYHYLTLDYMTLPAFFVHSWAFKPSQLLLSLVIKQLLHGKDLHLTYWTDFLHLLQMALQ